MSDTTILEHYINIANYVTFDVRENKTIEYQGLN